MRYGDSGAVCLLFSLAFTAVGQDQAAPFAPLASQGRYVIECDGDCRGLRYLPYVDATIFHFGLTQPVPVLEIKGVWLGGTSFRWNFIRTAGGKPPDIYVHRWTSSGMNSGGDCRAPKSNNK